MAWKTVLLPTCCLVLAQAQSLDVECTRVQETIAKWRAEDKGLGRPGERVKLVLGATTREADRFPGERWIFLDFREDGSPSRPHLRADFNDLKQLETVADALEGQLDVVIFDWDVVKFCDWEQAHLKQIARLLTATGSFLLPADSLPHPDPHRKVPSDIAPAALEKQFRLDRKPWLPRSYSYPLGAPRATLNRATELFQRYQFKPALEKALLTVFKKVVPVTFTPRFLKAHPDARNGFQYFACSEP